MSCKYAISGEKEAISKIMGDTDLLLSLPPISAARRARRRLSDDDLRRVEESIAVYLEHPNKHIDGTREGQKKK